MYLYSHIHIHNLLFVFLLQGVQLYFLSCSKDYICVETFCGLVPAANTDKIKLQQISHHKISKQVLKLSQHSQQFPKYIISP